MKKNSWNNWWPAPFMFVLMLINFIPIKILDGWMGNIAATIIILLSFGVLLYAEAARRTIVKLTSQMSKKELDRVWDTREIIRRCFVEELDETLLEKGGEELIGWVEERQARKAKRLEDLQTELRLALSARDGTQLEVVKVFLAEAVLLHRLEAMVGSGAHREILLEDLKKERIAAGRRFLGALHQFDIPLRQVCSTADNTARAAILEVVKSAFENDELLGTHPAAADLIRFCLTRRDDQTEAETPPATTTS